MKIKKIKYIDANNLFRHSNSQPILYDEIKFDKNIKIEDSLRTPDDSYVGYFFGVDLKSPDEIKEKTEHFLFRPEKKISSRDKISE